MSQQELLIRVVTVLEETITPYLLTGSVASSLQGEPRASHDIDLVVAMEAAGIPALVAAFLPPDFYELQFAKLDQTYLDTWAGHLSVEQLLANLREAAQPL
jgi:hypothetical protein